VNTLKIAVAWIVLLIAFSFPAKAGVPEALLLYVLHGIEAREIVTRPEKGVVASFRPTPDGGLWFTISFADEDNTRLLFTYHYTVLPNCMVKAVVLTTAFKEGRDALSARKDMILDWRKVSGLSFVKVLGINNTVVDGLKVQCRTDTGIACENPIGRSDTWNWPTVADEKRATLALAKFKSEFCRETTQ
jgi:hypothetical protein